MSLHIHNKIDIQTENTPQQLYLIMTPEAYRTPENIRMKFSPSSKPKSTCRRTLYTPRTRTTLQIRRANRKVTDINIVLKSLHTKSTIAHKRKQTVQEYRHKLKIATIESVKCMYNEYVKRKLDELSAHMADACCKEVNLEDFFTPTKPTRRHMIGGVSTAESPLAVPVE